MALAFQQAEKPGQLVAKDQESLRVLVQQLAEFFHRDVVHEEAPPYRWRARRREQGFRHRCGVLPVPQCRADRSAVHLLALLRDDLLDLPSRQAPAHTPALRPLQAV